MINIKLPMNLNENFKYFLLFNPSNLFMSPIMSYANDQKDEDFPDD